MVFYRREEDIFFNPGNCLEKKVSCVQIRVRSSDSLKTFHSHSPSGRWEKSRGSPRHDERKETRTMRKRSIVEWGQRGASGLQRIQKAGGHSRKGGTRRGQICTAFFDSTFFFAYSHNRCLVAFCVCFLFLPLCYHTCCSKSACFFKHARCTCVYFRCLC